MKILITIVLLCLCLSKAQAQFVETSRIVPGERIGEVSLGMSRNQVMAALPYHKGSMKHTFGVEEIIFLYTSGYDSRNAIVDVLLMKDKVVQIATSDQGDKIEGGYNTGSSMAQVKTSFPELVTKTYYFTAQGGSETRKFYDDVDAGVAFAVSDLGARAREMIGNFESPDFIVVHAKGRPSIAIWNKVRAGTQAPPQKKPAPLKRVALSRSQKTNATSALNALRRLESAVRVGLTYVDYSERVVNTKVIVDEKLRSVPTSDLKSQLQSSMASFASARFGWKTSLDTDLELMQNMGERMMQGDWNRASESLRKAEALMR